MWLILVLLLAWGRADEIDIGTPAAPPAPGDVSHACAPALPQDRYTWCLGCDGVVYSGNTGPANDACGVCGGLNTTCCGAAGACGGHGACSADVQGCVCDEAYVGPLCQVRRRLSCRVPCGTNGECNEQTGMCHCTEGWTGFACEHIDCGLHARFDHEKKACACRPGFTGDRCNECGGAPANSSYLCLGRLGAYHLAAVPDRSKWQYVGRKYHGMDFFDPVQNPKYACDCATVDYTVRRDSLLTNPREVTAEDGFAAIDFVLRTEYERDEQSAVSTWLVVQEFQQAADRSAYYHSLPVAIFGVVTVFLIAVTIIAVVLYIQIQGTPKMN